MCVRAWQNRRAMSTVVKDSGERALLPPFTDEHEQLRESIGRWVREEIVPNVDAWEEAREFPRELYNRAGELGFLGLKYPEELGGQGGDYVHDAVWAEELAAAGASGGVGAGLGAHTGIATPPVFKFGTPDQHERFLRPAIRGERIAALGITEPGAGSDVASIRTSRREGRRRLRRQRLEDVHHQRRPRRLPRLRGQDHRGGRPPGISFLILERDMPGYEVVSKLEKMGWHSSDTGELAFTDVEVPEENLLGEENRGFYLIMANFAWERLLMSLGAVGGMKRLLDVTVAYALERQAFGRPIGHFQVIRHKVAEMATRAEACRSLTYAALRDYVAGEDVISEVAMAKLLTQRAMLEVADECLQIHGGYGYMREYGIERAVRDARLGPDRRRHGRGHEGDPRASSWGCSAHDALHLPDARPVFHYRSAVMLGRCRQAPALACKAAKPPQVVRKLRRRTCSQWDCLTARARSSPDRRAGSAGPRRSSSSARAPKVLINDIDGDVAEQAASEIEGETSVFSGDLTKPGVPDELVKKALDDFGRSTSSSTTPATPGTASSTG